MRPFLLSIEDQNDVLQRMRDGVKVEIVSTEYGVSKQTIYRICKRHGLHVKRSRIPLSEETRIRLVRGLRLSYAEGRRPKQVWSDASREKLSRTRKERFLSGTIKAIRKRCVGELYIEPRTGYTKVAIANRRDVLHHRVIAETALGRSLKRWEVVHHINGDKGDNRHSNLLICTQKYHAELHQRMSELYQMQTFGRRPQS